MSYFSFSRCIALSETLLLVTTTYDYTVEVRNRFKGLDLIDRVPDELCTEVCDIVQETGIKAIPKKKECKQAKQLGRSQDGGGIERGDHFLFYKFIERTTER